MKRCIYITGIFVLLFSCQKDRLKDEKAIFIGTWNWIYSEHEYNICQGFAQNEILTPETESMTYSMEFFERGIVKFYENGNLISRDRLIFAQYGDPVWFGAEYTSFDIYLNKYNYDNDSYIQGSVSPETLIFNRLFPFKNDYCNRYESHFEKE